MVKIEGNFTRKFHYHYEFFYAPDYNCQRPLPWVLIPVAPWHPPLRNVFLLVCVQTGADLK
jgi:hypothetical protein